MKVNRHTGEIPRDTYLPNGDFSAVLTELVVEQSGVPYVLWHRLGRKVTYIKIVWKDDFCDWAFVRDSQGQVISDSEKVQVKFSQSNCTVRIELG